MANWAIQPFKRFLDQADRLNDLSHLSVGGISMATTVVPNAINIIAKFEETFGTTEHEQRRERALKNAELAKREIGNQTL